MLKNPLLPLQLIRHHEFLFTIIFNKHSQVTGEPLIDGTDT